MNKNKDNQIVLNVEYSTYTSNDNKSSLSFDINKGKYYYSNDEPRTHVGNFKKIEKDIYLFKDGSLKNEIAFINFYENQLKLIDIYNNTKVEIWNKYDNQLTIHGDIEE